jgi:hypothetical protein
MAYAYSVLSPAAVSEMNSAWRDRRAALFQRVVVDRFVWDMVDRAISKDLKGRLMNTIKSAKRKSDLWVTADLCFEPNFRFVDFYFPGMWISIKQLIYRTDALSRLAAKLGPCIKVRPMYEDDVIFLRIEFWPTS